MKTFKFYAAASRFFISTNDYSGLDGIEREYYHFASVLFSWVALESYINATSESLSKGTRLSDHEKAFLLEQELRVNDDGLLHEVAIRPSTTRKILFLIHYFSKVEVSEFKQRQMWKNLKSFEDLRNRILHHKEIGDIRIDLRKASEYRNLVAETIMYFNKLLFRRR